jgi:caffeic acid 3-O-methyltransferase
MAANSSISDHAQAVPEDDHHATPLRHKIGGEQDAAMYAAMRLTMTSPVPAALKAAIELGVFEILAKARGIGKSLTAKEIASQVVQPVSGLSVINHGCLERILRLLASENVVSESAVTVASGNSSSYSNRSTERCYALLPVGTYFVRSDEDGASLAPLLFLEQDRDFQEGWHHLSATLLDDSTEPFRRAHGESYFQYTSHNPRFSDFLNAGMGNQSRLYMQAVLRTYHGFQDVKCLVDVGGGTGSSLALITAKYPHMRGINYDLPHVAAASPAYLGVEHIGGNMFESVPSGDAIFMKWILHGWNDSECVTILRNCFNALPASGGKVILVESVLPDFVLHSEIDAGMRAALQMDLIVMMLNTVGAKERTLQEFRQLAMAAGFASVCVVVTVDFLSVLEFNKA